MRLLETNDWILLNNMIYKIYTTSNADEMRLQFMEQLRLLIDFDSAEFSMASADGRTVRMSRWFTAVGLMRDIIPCAWS